MECSVMTKALLISDTHGHVDMINTLVEKTNADMVIHAGDFGFYNESSYKHISSRELLLLVSHSKYWKDYCVDKKTDREMLINIVKKHNLLGDFSEYQDNAKQFKVPVYAVYGNHEDVCVIREVKEKSICNFNLLLCELSTLLNHRHNTIRQVNFYLFSRLVFY